MASFVGTIGPGQILDRDSLVAIPAGFAKVRLYKILNYILIKAVWVDNNLQKPLDWKESNCFSLTF